MTWTKQVTKTLPPTGNRTVTLSTVDGVQQVRYHAIDTSGEGPAAKATTPPSRWRPCCKRIPRSTSPR